MDVDTVEAVDEHHPVFELPEMVGEIIKNGSLSPVQLLDLLRTGKQVSAAGVRENLKDPAYWRRAFQQHFGHTEWASAFSYLMRVSRLPEFGDYARAVADNTTGVVVHDVTKWAPLEVAMSLYSTAARMAFVTAITYLGNYILEQFELGSELWGDAKLWRTPFRSIRSDSAVGNAAFDVSDTIIDAAAHAFARHLYDMVSEHWDTFHPSPAEQERIWQKKPGRAVTMSTGFYVPVSGETQAELAYFKVHGTAHSLRIHARAADDPSADGGDARRIVVSPVAGVTMFLTSRLRAYRDAEGPAKYTVERTITLQHITVGSCGNSVSMKSNYPSMPSWPKRVFTRHGIALNGFSSLKPASISNMSALNAGTELVPVDRVAVLDDLRRALVSTGALKPDEKITSLRTIINALTQLDSDTRYSLGAAMGDWNALLGMLHAAMHGKRNALGLPNMYRVPALPSRLAACATCGHPEPSHVDPAAQRAYCAHCVRHLDA